MPTLRRCTGTSVIDRPSMKMSPASGLQKSGDHAQRSGLAAAAWAKQRDNAARFDGKRHAIDGASRAELLDQFAQANRRLP